MDRPSSRGIPEQKRCWVCFGTEADDFEEINEWVSPCKCRGTTRWVHQKCVQRWVDEKLRENINAQVHCPQCNTLYIIVYKEVNYFVQALNKMDKKVNQFCPFLAAGVVVSTLYWSAASYGAITVMQVLGEQEAITFMEHSDPYILLLLLPIIPLSLILGKTINWEATLLRPILPSFMCEPVNQPTTSVQMNSAINPTTTFCAALLLPTTATIVGSFILYNSSYSNFQKTILGGLVYIAVKGAVRMYQRKHNIMKQRSRRVLDYPVMTFHESYEENLE